MSFPDFGTWCLEHDITPAEAPAALAVYLHELSGGTWDGDMRRVDDGDGDADA